MTGKIIQIDSDIIMMRHDVINTILIIMTSPFEPSIIITSFYVSKL